MKDFRKALSHIEREIKKQEAFIARRVAKCEQLKRNFNAMRQFVSSMPPSSTSGEQGIKRNLLPVIIEFVGKNPGCSVRDIRTAISASEQTVRYHLNRNSEKFKRADRDGTVSYRLAPRRNGRDEATAAI